MEEEEGEGDRRTGKRERVWSCRWVARRRTMAGDEREGEEESRGENKGRRGEIREHGRGRVLSCRWRGKERWVAE